MSFKFPENLKAYHTEWERQLNIKESLSLSLPARRPILKAARDPSQANNAPILSNRTLASSIPMSGFDHSILEMAPDLPTSSPDIPASSSSQSLPLAVSTSTQAASSTLTTAPALSQPSMLQRLARGQVAKVVKSMPQPTEKKKRQRCCRKCGLMSPLCIGNKQVIKCTRPCRDCGKVDCQGRNPSKRGDHWKCWDSWS